MAKLTEKRIEELLKAERLLDALKAGGVDNWDGYSFATEEIRKEDALADEISEMMDEVYECLATGAYEPSERGAGFTFDCDSMIKGERIIQAFITAKLAENS